MRDSGLKLLIGNADDAYKQQAVQDGFTVQSVADAARAADVILMLIPDEVQPRVFETDVKPGLARGKTLCFASGYNIHYKQVAPPDFVDVILVAPRMIGKAVRSLFQQELGYPCLLGVEQDATGNALATALAVAKAIGATRLGAFASSFREETVIDLFAEQMLWPGINSLCTLFFEKLVAQGCDPEIVATELHLSGEFLEIARAMITEGFFKQLKLHSHTSQYGQLTRGERMAPKALLDAADKSMQEICSGAFAVEWAKEQQNGLPTLNRMWQQVLAHPLTKAEERLEDLRQVVAKAHASA
jgi:ketol-acid reductoisomerase